MSPTAHKGTAISFEVISGEFKALRIYSIRNFVLYLLTPWSRVLLEKLTGSAASQEIPRTL